MWRVHLGILLVHHGLCRRQAKLRRVVAAALPQTARPAGLKVLLVVNPFSGGKTGGQTAVIVQTRLEVSEASLGPHKLAAWVYATYPLRYSCALTWTERRARCPPWPSSVWLDARVCVAQANGFVVTRKDTQFSGHAKEMARELDLSAYNCVATIGGDGA